jgi:hypothetical protein
LTGVNGLAVRVESVILHQKSEKRREKREEKREKRREKIVKDFKSLNYQTW